MKYTGQYIWPPRPGGATAPGSNLFKTLESNPNWIAQAKLNGSNTQMVLIDNEPEFFNRHNAKSRYVALPEQIEFFKALEKFSPLVLNLECLHGKVTTRKHQLYVFDVLVFCGEWLVGSTVQDRQKVLDQMFSETLPTPYRFATMIGPRVWRAVNFDCGWLDLFSQHEKVDCFEGLVLKNLAGKLEAGWREKNNTGWAIRSRIRDS